ncbi:hypothetical protein CYMTET_48323 [Cymbomonas tetramitiformis]|uniref:Uncharacterized protein n=1 Tax=Cymbomonas tetramitiformis TaxID=36881 RepID=A0AAE0BTK3_9CHLO|nr:hypothetical protein CYMTET_48323 [Cymbomonas tetramitiformis]
MSENVWYDGALNSQRDDDSEEFGLLAAYRKSQENSTEMTVPGKENEKSGVNIEDNSKRTPLHWAAWKGHTEVVEALVKEGAEVDSRDYNKCTPLSWAARHGHEHVVEVLLKYGAMLDAVDEAKRTPLHWAAEKGHVNIVRILLLHGASKDQHDMFVRTPLHGAAQHGHSDVVELLLERGVDIKIGAKNEPTTPFLASPFSLFESIGRIFGSEQKRALTGPSSRQDDDLSFQG